MESALPYALFPVINCGIDWLTVTSKRRGVSNALEDFGVEVLSKEKAANGRMKAAWCLGFKGHSSDNIFLGTRPGDVMLRMSGSSCTPLAAQAITLSSNVSRIDFQVTVWTEGEAVDLAGWTYRQMMRERPNRLSEGALSLIHSEPSGDTLSINKRVGQSYGRLYDKTAESDLGPPRLVWRYEVELKGIAARQRAKQLIGCVAYPQFVNTLVHDWYTRKGVQPAFALTTNEKTFQPTIEAPKRDVLTWFRESLSKTVKSAIAVHGRGAVLDALGLNEPTQGETNYAGRPSLHSTMARDIALHPAQSEMPERVLLQQPEFPERTHPA